MNFKTYLIAIVVMSLGLLAAPTSFIFAQETGQDLQAVIVHLQQQIESLQAQIEQLKSELSVTKSELIEVSAELKFSRALHRGVSGDDVSALQEFLKQFPDIYPEGLVTGYFGSLTEAAVQRLQEKENIVSGGTPVTTGYGQVGPKTREKLNELVTNGAGSSGVIPPGLTTAPGVPESIATTTTEATTTPQTTTAPAVAATTPHETVPAVPATPAEPATPPSGGGGGGAAPTTPATPATPAIPTEPEPEPEPEEDTTAPTISNIQTSSITQSSATISWSTNESANGTLVYALNTSLSGATTTAESSYTTSHSFSLILLAADTTYYYTVTSTDESDNTATSSVQSFTTSAPPPQPPPPSGSSDGPLITAFSITPLSAPASTVRTWSITAEDQNGVGNVNFRVKHPSTTQITSPNCNFTQTQYVSGNTCSFSEPWFDQYNTGDYTLVEINASDSLGNISRYYPDGTVTGRSESTHNLSFPVLTVTSE